MTTSGTVWNAPSRVPEFQTRLCFCSDLCAPWRPSALFLHALRGRFLLEKDAFLHFVPLIEYPSMESLFKVGGGRLRRGKKKEGGEEEQKKLRSGGWHRMQSDMASLEVRTEGPPTGVLGLGERGGDLTARLTAPFSPSLLETAPRFSEAGHTGP